jgi:hypothetical protein
MMNGEYEYRDTFTSTAWLPHTRYVLFLGFLLFMSMLLGNLLISLAVNQLQTLLQKARTMRLKSTMDLILNLESVLPSQHLLFFPRFVQVTYCTPASDVHFFQIQSARFRVLI